MTVAKYQAMNLNELRQYVLIHREDVEAFYVYIDRSKSAGRMISLDLTDNQWEENVKQAIRDSSKAIRWYCHKTAKDSPEFQQITTWWRGLERKNVTKYHITGIEIGRATGILKPSQVTPPVKVIISEPSLEVGEVTTLVKYKDRDSFVNQIEAVGIDLDLEKQNLFVWPTTEAEVFIFSIGTV